MTIELGKFKPSTLTAYERFEALIPILSEASEAYFRLFTDKPSRQRDEEINGRLTALFERVSKSSTMSVEEVRRAFLGYTVKGLPGLTTPAPIDIKAMVDSARGTWELVARTTNGGNTPHARPENHKSRARSHFYYETTSETEMNELCLMWNDENHYPRDESVEFGVIPENGTYMGAAFAKSKMRQVDEYTAEYTAAVHVCGSFMPFRVPSRGETRVLLMNIDGAPTFIAPSQDWGIVKNGESEMKISGTPSIMMMLNQTGREGALMRFSMSGLPPLAGSRRTMDVTDEYVKISNQQPLIAGWEPIETYFKRLINVQEHAEQVGKRSVNPRANHGFYAEDRDALKRYDIK